MTNTAAAFTVDRKTFADAAAKVVRYVPERPPVPVLRGILITADGASFWMVATDYEDTARASATADVEQAGRVLVDGAALARIVRNLPGDTIRIMVDGMYVVITSGPTTYKLLTMPADDYPNMDEAEALELGSIKAAGPDKRERDLSSPESFMKGFRKTWKASKTKTLYAPTDLAPGAWITWKRPTEDGTIEVTGQVWASAPGKRAVWALVEGERTAVWVEEREYGSGSYRTGDYRKVTQLDEVAWKAPSRAVAA